MIRRGSIPVASADASLRYALIVDCVIRLDLRARYRLRTARTDSDCALPEPVLASYFA
jgi:hypothetical protein